MVRFGVRGAVGGFLFAGVAVLVFGIHLRRRKPLQKRKVVNDGKRRIMLVVTGSIAAVKAEAIVKSLILDHNIFVDLVFTRSGAFFQSISYRGIRGLTELDRLKMLMVEDGTPRLSVWHDEDEWSAYGNVGDAVLHIDLAKRNKLMLVAPLCANTLSSFIHGAANSLATSVHRAWYYNMDPVFEASISQRYGDHILRRPLVVAPSMNTFMWFQKTTQEHINELRRRGAKVLEPTVKTLACGDTGKGAMAEVTDIVREACALLEEYEIAEQSASANGKPSFMPQ